MSASQLLRSTQTYIREAVSISSKCWERESVYTGKRQREDRDNMLPVRKLQQRHGGLTLCQKTVEKSVVRAMSGVR